jgi:hypothetical protein
MNETNYNNNNNNNSQMHEISPCHIQNLNELLLIVTKATQYLNQLSELVKQKDTNIQHLQFQLELQTKQISLLKNMKGVSFNLLTPTTGSISNKTSPTNTVLHPSNGSSHQEITAAYITPPRLLSCTTQSLLSENTFTTNLSFNEKENIDVNSL